MSRAGIQLIAVDIGVTDETMNVQSRVVVSFGFGLRTKKRRLSSSGSKRELHLLGQKGVGESKVRFHATSWQCVLCQEKVS